MGKLSEHMEFVIEPNQLLDVKKFILEAKQRNQIQLTIADSIGYCSQDELIMRNNSSTNGERVYLGCMAGCKAVAIESNGDVKGCLSLQNERFIEGNIRERSLKDIWTDKKALIIIGTLIRKVLADIVQNVYMPTYAEEDAHH